MSQDKELLDLVKTLQSRVNQLDREVTSLRLVNAADVPEDVLVAIAAGVSAYLGYQGEKRQQRFAAMPTWTKGTRVAQLNHTPVR
ncbi:MAG: hypothetical protein LBV00_09875 [Propionibacteriaceae bacterium]|jgi:methylmalonyl-CoA carboxyltransferase large subunit|nr:hypothetical protein [Propionibacteriaceae bacterium]